MNYRIDKIEYNPRDASLLQQWQSLLDAATSPEKIYQSPTYFAFLLDSPDSCAQVALLAVKDTATGELIGLVPLRRGGKTFNFKLNSNLSWSPRLQTILLLGSVPLLPKVPGLTETVFAAVFELFPDCDVISMTALPQESELNRELCGGALSKDYLLHTVDGWRDAHVIPLPESFDAYLGRYSSKKRFNLKRQVRLLREHSQNTLQLHRITQPDQVPLYINAWRQLAPPALIRDFLATNKVQSLASYGLLHGYLLMLSGAPCAMITATHSAGVLHVQRIIYAQELARFSAGVCVLYLAIEDLIGQGHFKAIDLGYSNPTHSDQASNIVQIRGNQLLLRWTWRNQLLCWAHDRYTALISAVKTIVQSIRAR